MTYRARFFNRRKKREKMEIKAIITTWSTKSKTPSRSQFVTDKKHCVAGRLMLFWYLKINIDKKTFFFTLSSLIYLARDYCPSTARELNDLILNRIRKLGKTASWISPWFNSLIRRADICLCRSTYSVISVEKKTRIYKIRQTSWMLLRVKNAQKYNPSVYGRY